MAVMLDRIYKTALEQFGLRLIAGGQGIHTAVNWVHVVETANYTDFLAGQELVVTTGLVNPDEAELLDFTKSIYDAHSSGLVLNIGPHIARVPPDVRKFGDENGFPIFTLPWPVRLEEFDHTLCNLIYRTEQENETLADAFRSAVMRPEDRDSFLPVLGRSGITEQTPLCMVFTAVTLETRDASFDETRFFMRFERNVEQAAATAARQYAVFRSGNFVTTVLVGTDPDEAERAAAQLQKTPVSGKTDETVTVVSGPGVHLSNLPMTYDRLQKLCRYNAALRIPLQKESDAGAIRLLLGVSDPLVLEDYVSRVLGPLSAAGDKAKLLEQVLWAYLTSNNNASAAAEQCYLHRNTVNSYLKKIEELTGRNLDDVLDREAFFLAFQIRHLLHPSEKS